MIAEERTWSTRNQLLLFFVLTYAITIAATMASSRWPGIPAAGGRLGVKRLLIRFVHWKVGLVWYLAAFALAWIPLLYALVYGALGFPVPGMDPGVTVWFLLAQLAYTLYAGGRDVTRRQLAQPPTVLFGRGEGRSRGSSNLCLIRGSSRAIGARV